MSQSPQRKSTAGLKDSARVAELEEEVQELKRKLDRADSRLVSRAALLLFSSLVLYLFILFNRTLHISICYCIDVFIFIYDCIDLYDVSAEGRRSWLFVPGGGARARAGGGTGAIGAAEGGQRAARSLRQGESLSHCVFCPGGVATSDCVTYILAFYSLIGATATSNCNRGIECQHAAAVSSVSGGRLRADDGLQGGHHCDGPGPQARRTRETDGVIGTPTQYTVCILTRFLPYVFNMYALVCADLLLLYCIVLMLLMSVQLQKAKREKDKAVRIIVHLVGKVSHCLCCTVAVVVDSRTVVVVMLYSSSSSGGRL